MEMKFIIDGMYLSLVIIIGYMIHTIGKVKKDDVTYMKRLSNIIILVVGIFAALRLGIYVYAVAESTLDRVIVTTGFVIIALMYVVYYWKREKTNHSALAILSIAMISIIICNYLRQYMLDAPTKLLILLPLLVLYGNNYIKDARHKKFYKSLLIVLIVFSTVLPIEGYLNMYLKETKPVAVTKAYLESEAVELDEDERIQISGMKSTYGPFIVCVESMSNPSELKMMLEYHNGEVTELLRTQ